MPKPVALFGGTFDPVHFGHLRPAYELAQVLDAAELRFIPCQLPPLKDAAQASPELRVEMLEAALKGLPGCSVDKRELHREGPSYTVDTLSELRDEFPDTPLCLIVGADAWQGFPRWHRWQDILSLAHIVVAQRPGWPSGEVENTVPELADYVAQAQCTDPQELHASKAGRLYTHAVTQLEISSSAIRAMIADGKEPDFLLPSVVAQIIRRTGCYRS